VFGTPPAKLNSESEKRAERPPGYAPPVAAPEYVPTKPIDDTRIYTSAPRRLGSWVPNRPGDLSAGQPRGRSFGFQGPDQGYALTLAERFRDRLVLRPGEHDVDALAGGVAVALKRASLFGRAPIVHDLSVAFTVWGFLGDADDELVAERRPRFEEVADPHHYLEQRAVADAVPESTLRLTPDEVTQRHRAGWRDLLDL
jgi:hypothetical protein